jgi:hypothetical protein
MQQKKTVQTDKFNEKQKHLNMPDTPILSGLKIGD